MLKISKIVKAAFLYFFCLTALGISQAFAQENCIPSCEADDGKFLQLVPLTVDLSSLSGEPIRIAVITDAAQLELGIFDADHNGLWDSDDNPGHVVRYTVFADPDKTGNSAGLTQVAEFLSSDMESVDNDWREIILSHDLNDPDGEGNYNYLVEAAFQTVAADADDTRSNFKIRASGEVVVLPNNIISLAGVLIDDVFAFLFFSTGPVIYPDLTDCNFPDPLPDPGPGFGATLIATCDCDNDGIPNEENGTLETCIDPTNYDGDMSFEFQAQPAPDEIIDELTLWDGDADFGDGPDCPPPTDPNNPNNICGDGSDDTNDPDTPDDVPSFSNSPFAVDESASLFGIPSEDNQLLLFRRDGAVTYQIESPDGQTYTNTNPSGTEEWERFTLRRNDHPDGCDNTVADFCVDSIEAGVWTVNVLGMDLDNVIYFRVEFSASSVAPVPALSRWGVVVMILLFGMAGYLKFRKRRV